MTVPLKRYIIDGQSLTYAPLTLPSWPDRFMKGQTLAERFSVGIPGTSYATRATTAVTRVDPYLTPTDRTIILISDGGTTDLDSTGGSLTAAQLITATKNYCDARRAAGADLICIPTIVPSTILTGDEDTNRLSFNAQILANPSVVGADRVVNIAGIPELQNAADVAYYYDGTHYTALAAQIVANKWLNDLLGI